MIPPTLILGILASATGVGLFYWMKRRAFIRTTPYGTEGFKNYETKVATRFLERIGKWISYVLIILGVLFLWSYWSKKKKEKPHVASISFNLEPGSAWAGTCPKEMYL